MDSILTSIKKMLGIAEEYTNFDSDLIMHINSVFTILTQIGVGPSSGFSIIDEHASWTDFVAEDPRLESIKSYMYLKVKLLFDPPLNSATIESMKRLISELEWRLSVTVDPGDSKEDDTNGE